MIDLINFLEINGETSRTALLKVFAVPSGLMGDLIEVGIINVRYIQGEPYYSLA